MSMFAGVQDCPCGPMRSGRNPVDRPQSRAFEEDTSERQRWRQGPSERELFCFRARRGTKSWRSTMRISIPFVLAIFAMLPSPRGWAAVVTTTGDSGPGSLRQAIADATPGETLTFAVTSPITLTSGELLITTNLTITGPGASQLTVQRSAAAGTPNFRIFNIRSGTVTISGLTVNNGRADSGAGILNQATANLTMHDLVISGNRAAAVYGGGTGAGGGINNSRGTMTTFNCTISGNSASGGAGSAGGGARGGGVANDHGTMHLEQSTVSGNSATGGTGTAGAGGPSDGAGIANEDGDVILENSTVSGNSATPGAGSPEPDTPASGGLFNIGGTTALKQSNV